MEDAMIDLNTTPTKAEMSIHRRIDRLLRDMQKAGLCIFMNDGSLEVYRGKTPPRDRWGAVENSKSLMSFFDVEYCPMDGGATL